ncbi:glutamine--tRNA ligase/YqeY domain fusion protein [Chondrinema litorale]|uniref:glutamine--tRNA ligase/YqeY domain fusion protein n=1 Tax=Chondrinema litorale TaxID=2994555 RepID=UPI0025441D2C|nr:glutamine--tRNA ligase/YqeY domain fusion protein [Chondrinema litorale]UZR93590.1 glutamine--tRNA ligase/YqeY domain fusion protein [Chondrinema litorale]
MGNVEERQSLNFIESIIEKDISEKKNEARVHTRFPPEPNGYLHIGHAKSICLNFGLAQKYDGLCNLRFDDTNPEKENDEYVNSIKKDVKWLGFSWDEREFFASDYFQQLYDFAVALIKQGKAYVDDSTPDEINAMRGSTTEPGKESPYRNRSVEENLDLFAKMKDGEFESGSRILRAKIDMASPNIHLRDPALYRIKKVHHHRTGDAWNIYPMYDWAHGLSDSIEGITHSICTLEFEVHRPLYDWLLDQLNVFHPQQIEFARLNLTFTVLSKRKLLQLVTENHVNGWDDPRMPTISGLRRRGYTPTSLRNFATRIGVAKRDGIVDVAVLEHSVREDLNKYANRVMCVTDPLKITITNYPEGQTEILKAINNPEDPDAGTREIPFSKEIFIEKDDFMENPPKKFFRLSPGKEVRLKYAYIIKCEEVVKDENGEVVELLCTYDPETKSGSDTTGKKVKGTLHWASAEHALKIEVREYDRLFTVEDPSGDKEKDFKEFINPDSLVVISDALIEPSVKNAQVEKNYQFERKGYFCVDRESDENKLVFNRTVTLRDTWAKLNKK